MCYVDRKLFIFFNVKSNKTCNTDPVTRKKEEEVFMIELSDLFLTCECIIISFSGHCDTRSNKSRKFLRKFGFYWCTCVFIIKLLIH